MEGRVNKNNDPFNLLVFGISEIYTSSITPAILNADDFMLYPDIDDTQFNEKISIDFTNLSSVSVGDTFSLSAFGNELETSSIGAITTELWIDWVAANYNVKANNSTATRNNKVLEILASDSSESNLIIDTGNTGE